MRRRRHRNPMSMSGISHTLVPAAIGAAGAVAVDYAWQFLQPYLPSALTGSWYTAQAVKLALAFGIGLGARKVVGGDKGNAVMAGAVTVTLYNIAASAIGGQPGMAGLGAYIRPGLGAVATNPAVYIEKPARMAGMGRMGRMGAYMPMSGLGTMTAGGSLAPVMDASDMFD